ncbi:hypothetical protein B0H11DRAFT_1937460 [Mycena galericulata]|nr:hypothetical protein B0H11DRAFT_1937460 [Mycena galericulata]
MSGARTAAAETRNVVPVGICDVFCRPYRFSVDGMSRTSTDGPRASAPMIRSASRAQQHPSDANQRTNPSTPSDAYECTTGQSIDTAFLAHLRDMSGAFELLGLDAKMYDNESDWEGGSVTSTSYRAGDKMKVKFLEMISTPSSPFCTQEKAPTALQKYDGCCGCSPFHHASTSWSSSISDVAEYLTHPSATSSQVEIGLNASSPSRDVMPTPIMPFFGVRPLETNGSDQSWSEPISLSNSTYLPPFNARHAPQVITPANPPYGALGVHKASALATEKLVIEGELKKMAMTGESESEEQGSNTAAAVGCEGESAELLAAEADSFKQLKDQDLDNMMLGFELDSAKQWNLTQQGVEKPEASEVDKRVVESESDAEVVGRKKHQPAALRHALQDRENRIFHLGQEHQDALNNIPCLEKIRQHDAHVAEYSQWKAEAEESREQMNRMKREHSTALEAALQKTAAMNAEIELQVRNFTKRVGDLKEENERLRRRMDELQQENADKKFKRWPTPAQPTNRKISSQGAKTTNLGKSVRFDPSVSRVSKPVPAAGGSMGTPTVKPRASTAGTLIQTPKASTTLSSKATPPSTYSVLNRRVAPADASGSMRAPALKSRVSTAGTLIPTPKVSARPRLSSAKAAASTYALVNRRVASATPDKYQARFRAQGSKTRKLKPLITANVSTEGANEKLPFWEDFDPRERIRRISVGT